MQPMAGLVATLCGVFGLLFGSFANVVIHRVPDGRSVVSPPSACPGCGTPIAPRDNIPVVSWLLLRGRCRTCGEPISARYPLVELVCAVLFAITGYWLASMEPPNYWALPGMLLFTFMLLVVAVIDAETRRIPNAITYTLTPVLAVLLVGAALLDDDPGSSAARVLLAGLAASGTLLVLALINPRGMGMGDVKLAVSLGMALGFVGWGAVVMGLFGAFLLGSVVSVALIATRTRGRKDLIPFGPYLAIAAYLCLFLGQDLADGYLRLTGLA